MKHNLVERFFGFKMLWASSLHPPCSPVASILSFPSQDWIRHDARSRGISLLPWTLSRPNPLTSFALHRPHVLLPGWLSFFWLVDGEWMVDGGGVKIAGWNPANCAEGSVYIHCFNHFAPGPTNHWHMASRRAVHEGKWPLSWKGFSFPALN